MSSHESVNLDRRALLAAGGALMLGVVLRPLRASAQTKLRIGVIGSGRIGGTIGGLWVKAGHPVLFSSRHPDELKDLVAGLANSRVSICFPQSITNPERCGKVETVTLRYFESMASKCLIVGKCPLELRDLFGYNPVIEVDDPIE